MTTQVEKQLDPTVGEQTTSFLEQAIGATKQTEASRAEELIKTLTEEAMKGTVSWNKNLTVTFREAINLLDRQISEQLSEVMHHPELQKLEGSWRGLNYLVMNSETSSTLKIRMISITKKELHKDLSKAVEFDQSQIFKKVYESEFGSAGGEPYGALIGDYEFTNHPEDIESLRLMSNVAASGFSPFLSAASPALFGFDEWTELSKPRDLDKVFESLEYAQWRSFRESADSRFVSLTMPKVLARLPYGQATSPVEAFGFEEFDVDPVSGIAVNADHNDYCWMNSSYVLGVNLTDAFSKYGFCTAIRGAEGGGRVENLPTHFFMSDDGDPDMKCPTEIGITDRREAELGKLGFLPLCHYKNTNYAVFFGAQTCQKPGNYDSPEATANAAISARLPYMMATSRFAHYLKVMARDKIGSFMEAEDVESWLNRWILGYVNASEGGGQEIRAKYPLADARVQVKEIPGSPGSYNAVAWLKPWLQMEELTTSLRLVAKIPQSGG
ncbi:type VI secretion system contractile sheath large subunit [Vibrio parahaemolyticus]|uniref:type VI secretion system contractile sheath large subunit n=1 Tax=Vibrio parahaemolyticus TaxID=670 RepID=UPI00041ACF54|nr:type VI secretion system contractile sheath large subunit [Vibrio parahaemolyticus]ALG54297.1 protein ImpC [Vibrio parahaemolyticus]EGQ7684107.1 type VI secretion system contractile sheath large subunit [Vibrio parahaemolyticus]EGQ8182677.1 type VI secretion system contractile sheath large subunit [Vibrio parahaemolyticus]EGQ8545999.1 type VI secretion system contractile sheath large subunit [Vibrio parahaemolyticus]EHJ9986875.1 type VI secretion system contractile sheath large subunit [Vib